MHERHVPRRKRKVSEPHNATKKLKTTVRRESKEDRTMQRQSTRKTALLIAEQFSGTAYPVM